LWEFPRLAVSPEGRFLVLLSSALSINCGINLYEYYKKTDQKFSQKNKFSARWIKIVPWPVATKNRPSQRSATPSPPPLRPALFSASFWPSVGLCSQQGLHIPTYQEFKQRKKQVQFKSDAKCQQEKPAAAEQPGGIDLGPGRAQVGFSAAVASAAAVESERPPQSQNDRAPVDTAAAAAPPPPPPANPKDNSKLKGASASENGISKPKGKWHSFSSCQIFFFFS